MTRCSTFACVIPKVFPDMNLKISNKLKSYVNERIGINAVLLIGCTDFLQKKKSNYSLYCKEKVVLFWDFLLYTR